VKKADPAAEWLARHDPRQRPKRPHRRFTKPEDRRRVGLPTKILRLEDLGPPVNRTIEVTVIDDIEENRP
jgi:hypothetical protein